jgi:hypothetical protein
MQMAKINDLPLLSNPTEDMYCLVGKEDVQKVPWSAIMGQIGAPYIATTVAGMTDKTRVYVYQGSESGYTSGNWYYWNGSAWTSGGTYNSAAVNTDKTLTQSDKPADSAVVGKEIGSLKESLSNNISPNLFNPAVAKANVAISSGDGSEMNGFSGWEATDYIHVSKNDVLYFSSNGKPTPYSTGAFYDAQKKFTSGFGNPDNNNNNITVISDGYARFSFDSKKRKVANRKRLKNYIYSIRRA